MMTPAEQTKAVVDTGLFFLFAGVAMYSRATRRLEPLVIAAWVFILILWLT